MKSIADILLDQNFLLGLLSNFVASAIILGARLLWSRRLDSLFLRYRWGYAYRIAFILLSSAATAVLVGWLLYSLVVALSTLVVISVFQFCLEFKRWMDVGLVLADRSVAQGLDYEGALHLAQNSIDFYGTGAHKLTSSPAFDATMRRCNRSDRPTRFLLCDPDSAVLRKIAVQAQKSADTYKARVYDSLQRLAKLKTEDHLNIEVRFHSDPWESALQVFRIMFLNDKLCLVSHNAAGREEGTSLPQLVFSNFNDTDNRSSFYYPLKDYFEREWKEATSWDPTKYRNKKKL